MSEVEQSPTEPVSAPIPSSSSSTTGGANLNVNYFNDDHIRQQFWEATVPIAFQIYNGDITSLEEPFPLYYAVPRHAYLGLYIDRIVQHFRPFTSIFTSSTGGSFRDISSSERIESDQSGSPQQTPSPSASSASPDLASTSSTPYDDIWFEYDGIPLKWNLPVGVLFDLLFNSENDGSLHNNEIGQQQEKKEKHINKYLPWKVTVHFSSFPQEQLMRMDDESTVKWTYINILKEALFAKLGTTKPIMTLSRQDEAKLWSAIYETNMAEYDKVYNVLCEEESDKAVKSFPIRILVDRHVKKGLPSRLICIPGPNVQDKRLGDFLLENMPNLFQSKDSLSQNVSIFIQGVRPSLDTPLQWLLEYCVYPDQFLYICIIDHSVPQEEEDGQK